MIQLMLSLTSYLKNKTQFDHLMNENAPYLTDIYSEIDNEPAKHIHILIARKSSCSAAVISRLDETP